MYRHVGINSLTPSGFQGWATREKRCEFNDLAT